MLILFTILMNANLCETLQCYSCVSPLPASTPAEAQHALKSILYSAYNLPPVSKSCVTSDDVEFVTVLQSECSPGDQCMKISVKEQGLTFVMRGCQSALYRNGVTSTRIECDPINSPSVCRCNEPLCNSSRSFRFNTSLVTFIFIAIVSLFNNFC